MARSGVSDVRPSQGVGLPDNWFQPAQSSVRQTAIWLAFLLVICSHFTLTYNAIPDYLDLDSYTRGTAPTPYQYRMLPMFVFRELAGRPFVLAMVRHAPIHLHNAYQIVQAAMTMLAITGAVLATAGTLRLLTGDRQFSRWFSLLLVYMAYFNLTPAWGLSYTFPYDTPSLFFFSIGVYLIVSKRLWLYYLLLPLAILNRETICFLTVFFLVWRWRELRERSDAVNPRDWAVLATHGLVQAVVWLGLRTYQVRMFANNPTDAAVGGLIRQKFLFNLEELVKPQQWPVLLSCCAFLIPVVWLQRRWIRQSGVAWSCAVVLPLWFAGMMLVGVITEIRVFSECSAFVVLALALIVHNRFRPVESLEV